MPAQTLRFVANYNKVDVTVNFVNDDAGNTLLPGGEVTVPYGTIPTYEGIPVSSLAETADYKNKYHLVFTGWDKVVAPATETVTYKAQYSQYPYIYQLVQVIGDDTYRVDVPYGTDLSTVEPVALPSEEHNFVEWVGVEAGTLMPVGGQTVTATLSLNQYTVSFDGNGADGGDSLASMTRDYGTEVTLPAPTKTGHTFSGWYDNDTKKDSPYTITKTVQLKAKWTVKQYQITWNIEDVVDPVVQEYDYNAAVTAPAVTPKAGYTFAWDREVPTNMPDENLIINGTYTANTNTPYKVIHRGQNLTDPETYDVVVSPDENKTGTTDTNTQGEAKTLQHFTAQVFEQVNIDGDGNTVLEIKYTRKKYDVTFDLDGGTATPPIQNKQVYYEGKATKPNDPTKQGYEFGQWHYYDNDTSQWVQYNFDNQVTKDVALKAFWTAGDTTYTIVHRTQNVTLDGYDINETISNVPGTTGHQTTATAKSIAHFTAKEITQQTILGDGSTTVYVDYDRDEYTVTFNSKGGSVTPTAIKQKYGLQIANAPTDVITKAGYTFGGWSTTDGGSVMSWPYTVEGDATLYAVWTANTNTPYTVKHMGENLDGTAFDVTLKTETLYGTTDTNTTATVDSFNHFTAPELVTQVNIDGDGEAVVTIEYTRDSYNVTFNPDNGDDSTIKSVKYEGTVTAIAEPIKTGYTFNEWQIYDNDLEEWVSYAFSTQVTETITLKAAWNPVNVTVTFDLDGGTIAGFNTTQIYQFGGTITKPTNPTKNNYTFSHWEKDGVVGAYDFDTPINQTTTISLVAVYTGNPVSITVSGANASDVSVLVNGVTPYVSEPTNAKYNDEITVVVSEYDAAYNTAVLKVNTSPVSLTNYTYTFTIKGATTIDYVVTPITKTVTFMNGDTQFGDVVTVNKGAYVSAPSNTPTKDQYHTFSHWSSSVGGAAFVFDNTPIETDTILHAVFNKVKYTVTYNATKVTVYLNESGEPTVITGTQVERDKEIKVVPEEVPGKQVEKIEAISGGVTTTLTAPNYYYTVLGDVEIVATFKDIPVPQVTTTFSLTAPDDTPEGANIYMIGEFPGLDPEDPTPENNTTSNQWHNFSDTYKMTKVGSVYTLDLTTDQDAEFEYKYVYVTGANGEYRTWEVDRDPVDKNRTYTASATTTVNETVTTWNPPAQGEMVQVTFNVTMNVPDQKTWPTVLNNEIRIAGGVSDNEPEPTYTPIPGFTNAWNTDESDLKLTHVNGNNYTLTINVPVGTTFEYKFLAGRQWAVYGEDRSTNRTLTVSERNQEVTITDIAWKDHIYDLAALNGKDARLVKFTVNNLDSSNNMFIAGNLPQANWNGSYSGLEMEKSVDGTSFALDVWLEDNTSYLYKYTRDQDNVPGKKWEPDPNRNLDATTTVVNDTITTWGW
jgi:uncharacterized repeat protein (TIGR02543 family)